MPLAGQIEMLFETLEETEIPVTFTDLELLHPLIIARIRCPSRPNSARAEPVYPVLQT